MDLPTANRTPPIAVTPDTLELLDHLLSVDTVSARPNVELVEELRGRLERDGAAVRMIANTEGTKANLYATIGPSDKPGVLLSGHIDVVPVAGQDWSVPPFALTHRDGRLYGRGAADMKGFVACALSAARRASTRDLVTPLHLALSYDEEVGCLGVRDLIETMQEAPFRPMLCIVGEPTELAVATGHKGKRAIRVCCLGRAGHSALAPHALNAIHLATDLIAEIRVLQQQLAADGCKDSDYSIPYTTLHVGTIEGGVALNIVPDTCRFDMELRYLAADDPDAIIGRLKGLADGLVQAARQHAEEAAIRFEALNDYPGLDTSAESEAVEFVKRLTRANSTCKVAFGTEGGLFSEQLDIPTVVCGPGSMDQGHKADEFVTVDQLEQCETMLDRLLDCLERGVEPIKID